MRCHGGSGSQRWRSAEKVTLMAGHTWRCGTGCQQIAAKEDQMQAMPERRLKVAPLPHNAAEANEARGARCPFSPTAAFTSRGLEAQANASTANDAVRRCPARRLSPGSPAILSRVRGEPLRFEKRPESLKRCRQRGAAPHRSPFRRASGCRGIEDGACRCSRSTAREGALSAGISPV